MSSATTLNLPDEDDRPEATDRPTNRGGLIFLALEVEDLASGACKGVLLSRALAGPGPDPDAPALALKYRELARLAGRLAAALESD